VNLSATVLSFLLPTLLPAGDFAIEHVRVIPMTGEGVVLEDRNVVVRDGRIASIASETPRDVDRRVDGRGKFLVPGFVDMHSHLLSDDRIADEFAPAEMDVILANGVTTIRDPIGKPELLGVRERIAAGEMRGPTLYVGSPQLSARAFGRVYHGVAVTAPEEARAAVRRFKEEGYDAIKTTFGLTLPVYDAIVAAAKEASIPVIGHLDANVDLRRGLEAGHQIEHLDRFFEALLREDAPVRRSLSGSGVWQRPAWESLDHLDESRILALAKEVAESGVFNTPTLAFLNTSFGTGRTDEEIDASPDVRFVSPSVRAELLRGRARYWADPPPEARRRRFVELRNRITKALYESGANLMAGSDSPEWMLLYGFTLHRELDALVAAGVPPYGALEAATRNPAEWLGALDEFGTIEVGKRADLVLLAASPLDDIANTKRIEGVVAHGVWYDRETLDRMLDAAAARLSKAPPLEAEKTR